MIVTSVLKKGDELIHFEADLSPEEFSFIFNQGLNLLIEAGAMNPDYYKTLTEAGIELPN